nr:pregnancy zone protein isoform X4 [Crassostrea gigas]
MERRLLWLGLLHCVLAANASPDFLITVPASVYRGEEFDFCVTFPGTFQDGSVEVNAQMQLDDTDVVRYPPQTYLTVSEAIKCQKLVAPKREGYWTFNVTLQSHGSYVPNLPQWYPPRGNLSTTQTERVNVNTRREDADITLIQTDKPLYKPGQTVKFRILRLKANNRLRPDTDKIKWVYVENPSNIRVMQWKDVPTTQGIASLEMLLSNDPPQGNWVIKAIYNDSKEYSNTFSVEEYVLPKYEVSLTPPAYLLVDTQTIDFKVCAKYTYGKPVKGQLQVKVCYNSPYGYGWRRRGPQFIRPCTERLLEINGCTMVSVNASEIELNSRRYAIWGKLKINATVTEAGTGVVLSGQSQGPEVTIVSSTLEITDETDGSFKPAFPYRGKVTAKNPDESPIPQKRIQISASTYQLDSWRVALNVTTDDNGTALFAIKDLPENITSFSISAQDVDIQFESDNVYHKMSPGNAYKGVTRWYSPSNSYIQIDSFKQPVACGKDFQLDILYSTPSDTNYNFYVMVMSRGRIIYTTNKKHQFTKADSIQTTSSDSYQYLQMQKIPTTTPRPKVIISYPTPPIPKILNETIEAITGLPPILYRKRRSEKSCIDNTGKVFEDGSNFAPNVSEPCWMCNCVEGSIKYCAMQMCDEPQCSNYTLIEGTCCGFVCPEDDQPASVKQPCDFVSAMTCFSSLPQIQPTDMAATCSNLEKTKACLAPHEENCESDENFQNAMVSLTSVEPFCAGAAKCNVQKCYEDAGIDLTGGSSSPPNCDTFKTLQTCMAGISGVCEGNAIYDMTKQSLQGLESICSGTDGAQCNVQKCYDDAGIDLTGLSSMPQCDAFKALQACMKKMSTVCKGNTLYEITEQSLQNLKGICIGDGTDNCVDKSGEEIPHGKVFSPDLSDPCKSCTCDYGQATGCAYMYCDVPNCRYEMIPGTCCGFICLDSTIEPPAGVPNGCMDLRGNLVSDGEVFAPNRSDPCRMCSCENGETTKCNYIYCDAPPCERYKLVPGTCCGFICLENTNKPEEPLACIDELGNGIPNGEEVVNPRDPCKICTCEMGNLFCAEQICKIPVCRNFQHTEGTCCDGVCLDDMVKRSNLVGRVQIALPITAAFAPESQVIVFYVRSDGEVVSSSTRLEVEKCFDNKVNMEFVNSPIKPGTNATIRVSGDSGSACSIGVVDKSIELLKADHQLTPEKFYSLLSTDMMYDHYYSINDHFDRNCRDKNTENGTEKAVEILRNPYDVPVDSYQAFKNFGLRVFTNLKLETRPCVQYIYPMYHRVYAENSVDMMVPSLGNTNAAKNVRSFFPETWLWELELIGDSGQNTLVRKIPDTITEWKGNAICLNTASGLGISSISGITAFQPFFLSFTLPYSAVRNEVVPVLVTVFNYLTECLVMRISLRDSAEFRLQEATFMRTRTVCVCGGESETLRYLVIPLKIGEISIQAEAESIADDGTCGNSLVSREAMGVSDAVRRKLPVEAEGLENEYTYSSYLCPSGEPGLTLTENIKLQLPLDRIQDSERGFVNIIGDVMGPALTNLKDLLKMPYGCGEQNMASFAPNIFVLQYFYNTNMDVSRVLDDALRYMRVGYQRQLRYRHSDGSYSAFGESDGKSGSTWLTAFVVKCLGQSQKYIDIDRSDLNTSIAWFRRQQNEIGCFPKVGYTHSYYLKGGWGKGNDEEGTLTAFVLIAMLEAGLPKDDPAILGALRCLDLQDVKDTYMLTLMAYAYSLYDIKSTRRLEIMSMLRSKVKRKGTDMVYWSRDSEPKEEPTSPWGYYRAPSAEVEMTSYALLAYTVGNQPEAVINSKPIVMWLSKQRNAQGGFSSTQDTIIALQALSVYGSLVHQGGTDITVEIMGDQMSAAYGISGENNLVLQTAPIPKLPNDLSVTVRGVGCALVQANVKFNTPKLEAEPDFDLKISTHRSKYEPNNCAKRTINICASYKGASGQTKMAIVDVKMQTGWVPVRETLNKILSDRIMNTIGLQKYEIDGNVVHLYFEYFDVHRRCFVFDVEQDIELSDPKPAYVKIYDYYETDSSVTVEYDIKTICGTKEELPFLTPEEYEFGLSMTPDDEIVQVRIPIERINSSQPGPPGIKSCPVCTESMDVKSPEFTDIVCNSARIFKVNTARKDNVRYSMKIYADMKPKRKVPIHEFVKHQMQKACSCDILEQKDGKLMIFDTMDQYSKSKKELNLSKSTTIVQWTKIFERNVFKKNRKC